LIRPVRSAYGPDHADIYDALYAGRGKDYAAEAGALVHEARARRPDAASLLDVGCGTGGHLAHFRRYFPDVSGVEPSEAMRAKASARVPGVPVLPGDVESFATGRTYAVVTCLFSVIGYAASLDGAIARLAAHLDPGGVLIVEPWMFPEQYDVGHVGNDFVRAGDRAIFRMSHSGRDGDVSVLTMHYLVGSAGGVHHFTDVHRLRLAGEDRYHRAFAAAGLTATYQWPAFGRGLFVATAAPT